MLTDVVIANKSYTKVNLSEECAVDSIALRVVRQDCPDFLLPMKTMEIDGETEIRYELQDGIRLSYLPKQMSKKDFITMILNMLIPFKTCNDWFLDYHNFILDENYILVGKNGQSIKYVYIPSPEYASSDEKIKDFFTTLILKIDISDDPGYLVNALRIIKSQDSNLITLLEYFQKQGADSHTPAVQEPQASAPARQKPVPDQMPSKPTEPAPVHRPFRSILSDNKPEAPAAKETAAGAFIRPKAEEKKTEDSTGTFGKSDEKGRLMDNLFGDSEEPAKEKNQKGQGLFGWMKGKPKEGKEGKKSEKRGVQTANPRNETNVGMTPVREVQAAPQEPQYQPGQYQAVSASDPEDSTTIVDYDEEILDNTVLKLRLEDCSGCSCPEFIEIDLKRGFATIGRKDKNGVPQADFNFEAAVSFVSRRHFRVEKTADHWQVIDLDSGNGTFVNQNKLIPNIPVPLNQNDVIMISCNRRRLVYRVC